MDKSSESHTISTMGESVDKSNMDTKVDSTDTGQNKLSDAEQKRQQRNIMKNIVLISIAFLLNFISFGGLSKLQSSLHRDEGMGVINSSVIYACMIFSSMLLPGPLIKKLGHKWTICLAFVGYILWMAANGYAVWATMITASILVGLCAAPLWIAQSAYYVIVAAPYAKLTNTSEDIVITNFFGIFFFIFQLCMHFTTFFKFPMIHVYLVI